MNSELENIAIPGKSLTDEELEILLSEMESEPDEGITSSELRELFLKRSSKE